MSPSPSPTVEIYAEALEVHISNLHTRLVATLDALDEITRNHEMELHELHNQAHSLRARCQVFKTRAKDAEAERDGLKEDVNKLVEKEPVSSPPTIGPEEDVHSAYLPAILQSLMAELTAEKFAFSNLQRVSEARIAGLEAQVARRDAELNAFKLCSCRPSATAELSGSAYTPHRTKLQPAGTSLSKDQVRKAFEETAMRQRTLEIELDGLRRKLQSATSPHKLQRSAPQALGKTSAKPRDPLITHLRKQHVQPDTPPVLADIGRQLVHIGREVDTLQTKRGDMNIEFDVGTKNDGGHADDQEDERFRGVLLIEDECIRLRKSERSLRQELLLATAAASATEHSLKSLVKRLRRQIHKLRNPGTSGDSHGEADMEFEEESLNDVVSEHTITTHTATPLLTPPLCSFTPPLQYSTPPARTVSDDHAAHQLLSSGRPPSAPPFFARNPTQVQRDSAARLVRIESELNQARNDVKQKDQAINTLRAQLATLQTALQFRIQCESNGGKKGVHGALTPD